MHTVLTRRGHGGPPLMKDQLNAGATSETTRTWKTIHTIHAPSHSNNGNMNGWLWGPSDIRGPCGPKASWYLSLQVRKSLENLTQGTCPDGIEPGLAAWQARVLSPAPQRWTFNIHLHYITAWGRYYELSYMFLNALEVMSVNRIVINKALKGNCRIFRCIGRIFLT